VSLNPALLPLTQVDSRQLVNSLARTPLSQIVLLVVVLTILRVAIYPAIKNTKPHMRHGIYGFYRFANEFLDAMVYAAVFVFMVIRPFAIQAFLIPSGSMWPTLYVNDFIVANKAIYRYSNPKAGDIVVFRPPKEAVQSASDMDADGEVGVDFIKRCIGTPGDVIELRKGILYRNGQKVDETYIHLSKCTRKVGTDCVDFTDYTDAEKQDHLPQNFKFVKYGDRLIPLNYTDKDANSTNPRTDSVAVEGDQLPYNIAQAYAFSDPEEGLKAENLPAQPIPRGYYLMMGDNRNNSFDGRAWGLVSRDRIIGRSEFIWLPFSRWRRTQ